MKKQRVRNRDWSHLLKQGESNMVSDTITKCIQNIEVNLELQKNS